MKIKKILTLYLRHLKIIGRSIQTIETIKYGLYPFTKFLDQEKIIEVEQLTVDVMREYQEETAFRLTKKGNLLSLPTQAKLLGHVRGFTKFLKDEDYLIHDPGKKIIIPRLPRKLPKAILNQKEINKVIKASCPQTTQGYRNRIVLEILYDTAIRRQEIANIKINDMDLNAGYIHIHGKGNKERIVPLNQRVCGLIKNYIQFVRHEFVKDKDTGHLILNKYGNQMHGRGILEIVKKCIRNSGIKKTITTHTFRHTCATHMLKNGAPVRHLQDMLGHESLETTQNYTHVTINDLKKVHQKYHPGETIL